MTILQPNKQRGFINYLFASILFIFLAGGFYIYEYNYLVSLRHQIDDFESRILVLQNKDADLKNALFALIGSGELEKRLKEGGLVIEKSPRYLYLDNLYALSGEVEAP